MAFFSSPPHFFTLIYGITVNKFNSHTCLNVLVLNGQIYRHMFMSMCDTVEPFVTHCMLAVH